MHPFATMPNQRTPRRVPPPSSISMHKPTHFSTTGVFSFTAPFSVSMSSYQSISCPNKPIQHPSPFAVWISVLVVVMGATHRTTCPALVTCASSGVDINQFNNVSRFLCPPGATPEKPRARRKKDFQTQLFGWWKVCAGTHREEGKEE
ncbi:hypothetical protein AX14_011273 [Amanita brunnescens Koide BX004]|nr:hypothetical protein AX14_011273 [Amanita brunnescens Koide BX004]